MKIKTSKTGQNKLIYNDKEPTKEEKAIALSKEEERYKEMIKQRNIKIFDYGITITQKEIQETFERLDGMCNLKGAEEHLKFLKINEHELKK